MSAELDAAGKVRFTADSDSELTRGLAALLVEGLSGLTPDEVLQVSWLLPRLALRDAAGGHGSVQHKRCCCIQLALTGDFDVAAGRDFGARPKAELPSWPTIRCHLPCRWTLPAWGSWGWGLQC